MSACRLPARQRKIKSLRQCPIRENHDKHPLRTVVRQREFHPELVCHLCPEGPGELLGIDVICRRDLGAEKEGAADRVVELLVLDDVAAVPEEERGDRVDDPRSLRAAQCQDEGLRHRRLLSTR